MTRQETRQAVPSTFALPASSPEPAGDLVPVPPRNPFDAGALQILDQCRRDLRGEPDLAALQVMLAGLAHPGFVRSVAAEVEGLGGAGDGAIQALLVELTLRVRFLISRRNTSSKGIEIVCVGGSTGLLAAALIAPLTMSDTSPLYAVVCALTAGVAIIVGLHGYRRLQDELHLLGSILRSVEHIARSAGMEVV